MGKSCAENVPKAHVPNTDKLPKGKRWAPLILSLGCILALIPDTSHFLQM